jgi:hypothetical protein
LEALDIVLKYAVVPVLAFVYGLHMRQNTTSTDLKVLEATMLAEKRAHDLEMKNLQVLMQKVFDRLEGLDVKLTQLISERN